jgi:biotin carboxyl carrier protein
MIAILLALMLQTGAVEADPIADLISATTEAREVVAQEPEAEVEPSPETRRGRFLAYQDVGCTGRRVQGGLVVCRYGPGSTVTLGETTSITNSEGYVVLGIPRQAPAVLNFSVAPSDREPAEFITHINETWAITQREYDIQRVDGVPQRTVTPDPSTLQRRQREYAQKQTAFNSLWDGQGFLDGFTAPSHGITTGVYGSQRVYNGTPRSPHWGHDWANDVGTPVSAPASGRVTLAEADMYYEGGLIFIDHGQGLVSAFLHMSAVHVSEGDIVEQGQLIGEIGAGGRATGPHLDWRVKLRNGFYVDPALLLELDLSGIGAGG